ncbi:sphingosine kinase 1 [Pimephales promelas]|uniref:sphingosine kinase 1 n=1 Tax=Pimephales promelas TaxID=90988 RepID=UPI0019557A30|nr:sphingosine kinase 1 [Pimephales promelas]KAG1928650.1 sphingosine kinase [Pimephales promelas]
MDEPDASRQYQNGPAADALMHGVFTDTDTGRFTYALSLSDSCLTVQRINPPSPPPPSTSSSSEHLDLRDCLGSRAHRGEREDQGAYLCAYFYPYRRRWMSSSPVRQRDERRFRPVLNTEDNNDEEEEEEDVNLREAERWARAIRNNTARRTGNTHGVLFSEVRRLCGVMVLVNPQSGRGQAMALYNGHVQRMLTEADIPHTLVITERPNHARDLARNADLTQWDALVILSGDGLLFEVVNGLMERQDWEKAIQTPLGILPGGSGNALAASIHHYTRASPVSGEDLLTSCGFQLCKGQTSALDLISIRLSSGARLFSFLSLAWGFVADVDIESEQFRQIGDLRFLVGTLVRLASLRVYQGKLAFLPAENQPETHFDENKLIDHLLVPLDQPVPQDWTLVEEREFVLVLAMFQSHLSEDLMAAPDARSDDGTMHLFYVTAGISRAALLRLFRAMQSGTHLDLGCPHLVYRRARALRLEPLSPAGLMTVDGERVEYGPVQAQVHRGAARLIST